LLRGESFRDFPNDEIRETDQTSKKRLTGINGWSLKRDGLEENWIYLFCVFKLHELKKKKYIRNCDNNAHTLMHYKCCKCSIYPMQILSLKLRKS